MPLAVKLKGGNTALFDAAVVVAKVISPAVICVKPTPKLILFVFIFRFPVPRETPANIFTVAPLAVIVRFLSLTAIQSTISRAVVPLLVISSSPKSDGGAVAIGECASRARMCRNLARAFAFRY